VQVGNQGKKRREMREDRKQGEYENKNPHKLTI